MIRLQASAVVAVRDGYSGRPITASTVRCFLDGRPFLPQYRQGGYLVFLNLEPGRHELLLRGGWYQDEQLSLEIGETFPAEYLVTLKPSAAYPFRQAVTQLAVQVEKGPQAAGQILWLAIQGAVRELRLAQDQAPAGSQSLKVFYRGGWEGRPLGSYLLVDKGDGSEVVSLTALEEEQAQLAGPLVRTHRRGAILLPAQCYRADEEGWVRAFFREPEEICLFQPHSRKLRNLSLEAGYNQITLETGRKKE